MTEMAIFIERKIKRQKLLMNGIDQHSIVL